MNASVCCRWGQRFFRQISVLLLIGVAATAFADDKAEPLPELLIQSSPLQETLLQTAQPVTVLQQSEIHNRPSSTLGDILGSEAGVASNSFGPGASRPVIRGLSGDRVRVLEGGVGSLDVSNTSPDHPVSIDPLLIDQVEVVRGPATLLYGTSAVGGVVNVINDRIPTELPMSPVTGRVEGRLSTADEEKTGATSVTGKAGSFAFHVDGIARGTNNVQIPGFARTDALREEYLAEEAAEGKHGDEEEDPRFVLARDRLPNSSTETNSFSLGTSYIGENGYLGLSVDQYNTRYGLPSEDGAFIDAIRNRLGVKGELRDPFAGVSSIEVRGAVSDYSHTEFEPSGEPGTNFLNDGSEGRVDLRHSLSESWEGAFGVQLQHSDFSALGEESFQPPTETLVTSAFLFEEYRALDDLHFQLGSRFDYNDLETSPEDSLGLARVIPTWSFSGAIVWNPVEKSAVALSLNHTERAPSGQELFADGPHIATAAFEIGDPDLDTERVTGIDLSFRREDGPVTGSLAVYYNRFDNYIGLLNSGLEEDGLPVYLFRGVRADFYGFEATAKGSLLKEGRNEVTTDLQWDYVRAEDRDSIEELPRITPMRARLGVNLLRASAFSARVELQHLFRQSQVASFETETPSYTFLNSSISHTESFGATDVEFYLQGINLTDKLARNHLSFVKDLVPLPGRNVMVGARFRF